MIIQFYEKEIEGSIYQRKKRFDRAKEIILKADSSSETNDKDYVFSNYIKLPT
jgi:hypothetical protein